MEIANVFMGLIDFILHIDKHLEVFVASYGTWVYALLFLIIFVETGVVVMPFLPGDSLLFVVGAMCGVGLISLPLALAVLFVACALHVRLRLKYGSPAATTVPGATLDAVLKAP